jgi:hypothetical protein
MDQEDEYAELELGTVPHWHRRSQPRGLVPRSED